MQRYGMVIHIKPDMIDEYKKLHAEAWPGVLAVLRQHHVKNYSIFLKDNLLFGYLEYHGDNFAEDMKKVGEAEITKQWWQHTDPCQEPLATRAAGEWWAMMEPVFYME